MPDARWYERAATGATSSICIDDWDETFLSQLDAAAYLDLLKKAQFSRRWSMPTRTSGSATGLPLREDARRAQGKDFFGAMVEGCHREEWTSSPTTA
jgi:hypothetical protein